MQATNILFAAPIVILLVVSSITMLLNLFWKKQNNVLWFVFSYFCALLVVMGGQSKINDFAFGQQIFLDNFGFVVNCIILLSALIVTLISKGFEKKQALTNELDYHLLVSYSVIGAMVMANANSLLLLFVGFELLSVCVYVLAAIAKERRFSSEAGLKYFILGAFSSAFLLFGIAFIYGATGKLDITELVNSANLDSSMFISGFIMLLFGFGFKLSLVPFHIWTADVYQGAPTTVTAFMATVVKVAAVACFARFIIIGMSNMMDSLYYLVWALAVLSMVVGNLLALNQTSVKRILAFSSIAHAGYASIGFLCGEEGLQVTAFYMLVYALMSLVAFAIVLFVTSDSDDSIENFAGLGWSKPVWSFCMLLAVLSLAGIPPLAGFIAKLVLFKTAIEHNYTSLAIIGALSSVVSLYYYLKIIVFMYFKESEESKDYYNPEFLSKAGVVFALLLVVIVGIFPGSFIGLVGGL